MVIIADLEAALNAAEQLEALLQLESERRVALQLGFNNSAKVEGLLDSFERVEVALSEFYSRQGKVVEAIQSLDRAIITVGPRPNLLQSIACLEAEFSNFLANFNTRWKVGRISPDQPPSEPLVTRYENVECRSSPSIDYFFGARMNPIVLKDVISHWPALGEWQHLDFFAARHGHRLVPVEVGETYLEKSWGQRLTAFGEFLDYLVAGDCKEKLYLAQHDLFSQIPELKNWIQVPDLIAMQSDSVLWNIWIGRSGTTTPCHTDPYDNFFCQIVGYKTFFLVDPKYSQSLPICNNNTSSLDLASVDAASIDFPVRKVTLHPGNVLYVPKGWWHLVVGRTNSISISFWY